MSRWSRWLGLGAAAGIIVALVPVVRGSVDLNDPLKKVIQNEPETPEKLDLTGLDLTRLRIRPRRVLTPLPGGRYAELTLNPKVQRAAENMMRRYRVPEAGVVLMDIKSGQLVAYASHVEKGRKFDVNVRAEAPAASTFKVVTGSALVEKAGLTHKTEQCYHGGRSRISERELKDDPKRDKWCATLAMAMGRSINVIFARLAKKHLTPEELAEVGGAYGFGRSVPFVVENEPTTIEIPTDEVEFARTAAGFWHTKLSPLAGAVMAQTVANEGVSLQPRIIKAIYDGRDKVWQDPGNPVVTRRAIKKKTAAEVTKMMIQTVRNGSGYKSFHDRRGRAFIPRMAIAGKTGTLTNHKANRHYTWFVGFAPADRPEVAVAALVVNTPRWRIKGPQLAAGVLRAYFADKGWKGASAP